LVCTLLSTIWTLGDFSTVYFVSGGGPAMSTEVLATLGIQYAFTIADPRLGVAAVMSALPVLIPIVILLMRQVGMAGGPLLAAPSPAAGQSPAPATGCAATWWKQPAWRWVSC